MEIIELELRVSRLENLLAHCLKKIEREQLERMNEMYQYEMLRHSITDALKAGEK